MAVLNSSDRPAPSDNMCAVQFVLTWVGFFAIIGLGTWIASAL